METVLKWLLTKRQNPRFKKSTKQCSRKTTLYALAKGQALDHISEWEGCVRVGAVDGAIAPSELYAPPDFDSALDFRVGSLTTSTKPYSGKHHLVQSVAGQCFYTVLCSYRKSEEKTTAHNFILTDLIF